MPKTAVVDSIAIPSELADMNVQTINDKFLVIIAPLHKSPILSSTQKTLHVAAGDGTRKTTAVINGQQISVSLNATIKNPEYQGR